MAASHEELRERLERSTDEAALGAYWEAAREAGRRDEAVAFLKSLYARRGGRAVWALLERACTGPEIAGVRPPEETRVGPELDAKLERRPFPSLLPGVLGFPFASGSAVYMLVVAGPLVMGTSMLQPFLGCVGLLVMAPLWGFLVSYLFDVVVQSAEGRVRAPRVLTVLWSDVSRLTFLTHFGRWLSATIASFIPLTIFLSAVLTEDPSAASRPILWGLAIAAGAAGLVHYPISLLLVVFGEWWHPFNVARGIRIIKRLGRDYAVVVGFFLATTAATIAFQVGAQAVAGDVHERQNVARLLSGWVTYAGYLMQMRALGLLCYIRRDAATT